LNEKQQGAALHAAFAAFAAALYDAGYIALYLIEKMQSFETPNYSENTIMPMGPPAYPAFRTYLYHDVALAFSPTS